MNKKEMLKLPTRVWGQDKTTYDSIYVIPSGKKHDSGYAWMYIVGIINNEAVEIAGGCDDINWKIDPCTVFGNEENSYKIPNMRTDMLYQGGIIHFWGNNLKFVVGCSLSSTDIEVIQHG